MALANDVILRPFGRTQDKLRRRICFSCETTSDQRAKADSSSLRFSE
jgi:hypothetical protein